MTGTIRWEIRAQGTCYKARAATYRGVRMYITCGRRCETDTWSGWSVGLAWRGWQIEHEDDYGGERAAKHAALAMARRLAGPAARLFAANQRRGKAG